MGGEETAFDSKINEADALLVLLDGQRISSFMQNERIGKFWAINELPNVLQIIQKSEKPVHFVISKWDIIESYFSYEDENLILEKVRDSLLGIEEFKNLIKSRTQLRIPIRLIPVSSVGRGFASLKSDGSMKKSGVLPYPFQVEIPLACVLPDMIKLTLEQLIKEKQALNQTIIEAKPNLSFWDRLSQIVSGGFKAIQSLLPKKYQFAEDILEKLIESLEEPIQTKREAAIKRTEELRHEQEKSLEFVRNEETALNYAINCFLSIKNKLDSKFPASEIS